MPSDTPPWFREIDHTGDIGIEVTAPSLDVLFERAAIGTFHVLTDLSTVRAEETTSLRVEGRDLDALMVRWLSELNYRHTVDRVLYCNFDVESITRRDNAHTLTARIGGEQIDAERHTVYTEIKAITFHGLEVREAESGWTVQVIFDM